MMAWDGIKPPTRGFSDLTYLFLRVWIRLEEPVFIAFRLLFSLDKIEKFVLVLIVCCTIVALNY